MAEEEWIAQTQETLGKLISKPKMTERYLKKPPFRFLHDIVMEVVRSTNFGQGLYTPEECDAAQLSDKGAKVEFLNKAINVTSFALGESVHVSANKIVAGLEADKTNLFLQKLHAAATTCVGAKSDESVQRVLNGESVGGAKEKKKKKDDEPKTEEAKPAAPAGDDAPAPDEEAKKKEEDKRRRAERKKREEEKKKAAEDAEAAKAAEEEKAKADADSGAAAAAKEKEAEDEEAAKREKREEEKKKKEEDKKRREEKKRQQAEAEEKQRQEQEAAEAKAAAAAAAAAAADDERQRAAAAAAAAAEAEHFQEMPSAPGSAAQPTRPIPGDEEAAAREAMLAAQRGELGEDGMDRSQARPERPRTAGRRPPKVQSKVQTSSEPTAAATSAAPVFIAEGAKDDDDDDMFEQPANETMGFGMLKADEGAQHGKLVSDLLGEKKKQEEKERLKKEEEETREEFDDGQGKGIRMGKLKRKKGEVQQQAEVDIGALGTAIQSLCQAANPLGKSIDLVHQDITNMGKELDHWKSEHREATEQYQHQLKLTEDLLQPLYQKVAELDDKIAEQKSKIRNSRSRISKNDIKIQGLLESVVCAK